MIHHLEAQIEFRDNGKDGPPVLFLPGSYSTPSAWKALQNGLGRDYRIFGTSLCGYGESAETRNVKDFDIQHEIRVVEHAAERINEPFHIVGHSFGGTVTLAAALSDRFELLSITTFEANPLCLLQQGGFSDLFASTLEMASKFEQAWKAGDPDAAGLIIDFWGGPGTFLSLPENVQEYCRSTVYANVLDWYTDLSFTESLTSYRNIEIPTLLIRGALANEHMIKMTDLLAENIPGCRQDIVEDAGHFLISTHPEQCASILERFYADFGINK